MHDLRCATTEGEFDWNDIWNDGIELNVMGRAPWTTVGNSGGICMARAFHNVNRNQALQSEEEDAGQRHESKPAQCVSLLDLISVGEEEDGDQACHEVWASGQEAR